MFSPEEYQPIHRLTVFSAGGKWDRAVSNSGFFYRSSPVLLRPLLFHSSQMRAMSAWLAHCFSHSLSCCGDPWWLGFQTLGLFFWLEQVQFLWLGDVFLYYVSLASDSISPAPALEATREFPTLPSRGQAWLLPHSSSHTALTVRLAHAWALCSRSLQHLVFSLFSKICWMWCYTFNPRGRRIFEFADRLVYIQSSRTARACLGKQTRN